MQQIEAIPQLGENCHLPLNLAIITNTFLCSKNELPSTYCRTIITLALNCLLRHLQKNEYKSIEALESFSDVPDSLKEQFVMLCRIAYEGVACQKYSFSKQFLSDQARASCEVETFGLLQAVHSLVSSGSSTVYHFLHLSLQELCAAYYITSLPDTEEQIIKIKRLKTITTVVDTEIGMSQVKVERKFERRNPRFDPVCQFYAALTQLSNSRVLAALMDEYPPLNDNFTGYECVSMSTEHFLDNLPHCVNDSQTDQPRMCKVSHGFLHCLYEAQNPSLVKELGVTALKVTGDTSPPSLALAYLISIATGLKKFTYSKSSGIFSRQVFLEALVADALSKSTVEEVICKEVSFDSTDSHPKSLSTMLKNRKLKKLEMHECFGVQLFPFSALLNGSIEDLTVSSSNIDASIMLPLLEKLLLKRLNINCCGIGYTSMEAISKIPIICTTLKQFNISGNDISDGVDYLAKALVQTSLEELDISDCQIRNDGIIAIALALKATRTLISIDMHGNSFGTEGILAIAEALNYTSLQKLDIRYCDLTGKKGLLAIALALRSNTTLNCLAISESEGGYMEFIKTSIVQSLMENPRFISVYIENHLLLTDELQAKLLTKDILSIHMIYFPSTIHFNLTTSSPLKEAFCSGNLKMIVDILGLQKPPVRTDKLVIHFRYGEKETIIDVSQKMFIKLSLQPCQLCAKSLQYLSTTPYCRHLKYLDISGNRIGHSEAKLVATFLHRNPVEFLSISNCGIDSVGLESICSAIKTSSILKSLNISGNRIGHSEAALVATILQENPVEFLSISNCGIDSVGLESICSAIKTSSILKSLDISRNEMNDVKLPTTLTTMLSQTPLKELDMSHCYLREDTLAEVCTALSTNTTLTHLRLSGNDFFLSNHATSKLILILTSTPLEVIDIHGCSIAEDSMDEVYSALSTSTTIISISLSYNSVGPSATSHRGDLVERSSLYNLDAGNCDNVLEGIFEALRRNKSLTDLRLHVNPISHIAASHLATLLECSSLREIDISNGSKEGSSMEQFLEVLIHNSALTQLTLRGYSISHRCAIVLAELLEQSSLHKLDISNCDKEGSVIETLCQALIHSNRLTHLRLGGNDIGHSATGSILKSLNINHNRHLEAALVAAILRRNPVEFLSISNCSIDSVGMGSICSAIKTSSILKSLNISKNVMNDVKLPSAFTTMLSQTPLKELDMSHCDLREDAIAEVCTALSTNTTLTHLRLGGNDFVMSKQATSKLVLILTSTPLEVIDIHGCSIAEDNMDDIYSALSTSTTITHILLPNTRNYDQKNIVLDAIFEALRRNKSLTDLRLRVNRISHIAASCLTTLLECSSLREIDISDCSKEGSSMRQFLEVLIHNSTLTHLTLRGYSISHRCAIILAKLLKLSSLHKLDISNCDKEGSVMETLCQALTQSNRLTHLRLGGNDIGHSATSSMPVSFDMYRIGHSEAALVATILRRNPVEFLSISNCGIDSVGLESICSAIKTSSILKSLNISGNRIGHSEAALVATILQENPVEFLSISNCGIDSVGLESICSAIKTSSILKSLDISRNEMNDVKLPTTLTTMLSQTSLKELDMSHCDLREEVLTEVCTALSTNTTLTQLRLGGNDFILSKHASSKLILILTSTPLEVIDIHGCRIAEDSMDEVYSTLSTSTTITSISLSYSCIGSSATSHRGDLEGSSLHNLDTRTCDNGWESIFEALRHNKSLTDLRLHVNRISHIAASHLTTLLERSSLREIDIGNCSKEGSSMKQFVEVLIHNSTLTQLTLCGHSISHGCAIVLAELLQQSSLHKLDISNCDKEGSVIETLCQTLIHSNRLTHLTLSGNRISHGCAIILAKLLKQSSLHKLDISNCDKEGSVMETLCKPLRYNMRLTHLTLSGNYISCRAVLYLFDIIMRWCLRELDIRHCDIAESALGWLCETLAYIVKRTKIIVSSDTYRIITTVARAIEYSHDPRKRMHRNSRYYQTDQLDDNAMYYFHHLYHKTDHLHDFLMLVERSLIIDDSDSKRRIIQM